MSACLRLEARCFGLPYLSIYLSLLSLSFCFCLPPSMFVFVYLPVSVSLFLCMYPYISIYISQAHLTFREGLVIFGYHWRERFG